jgi:precorrin-6B methylase 2
VGCTSEKSASQKESTKKSTTTKQSSSTAPQATPKTRESTAGTTTTPPQKPAGENAGSTTTVTPTNAEAQQTTPAAEAAQEPKRPDVIFVPTPPAVVAKMLELARVTKDDVVYDLGCGDGRIVVAAAKIGCKAYGFDVDPQRIKESKENVEKNGVGNLATIEQKDIFTLDLSQANVVTLYLLPSLNVKLIPQLEKLKPGSRIVSHDFDMKGVTPDKVVQVDGDGGYEHTVYLWTTPLKKEAEKTE